MFCQYNDESVSNKTENRIKFGPLFPWKHRMLRDEEIQNQQHDKNDPENSEYFQYIFKLVQKIFFLQQYPRFTYSNCSDENQGKIDDTYNENDEKDFLVSWYGFMMKFL